MTFPPTQKITSIQELMPFPQDNLQLAQEPDRFSIQLKRVYSTRFAKDQGKLDDVPSDSQPIEPQNLSKKDTTSNSNDSWKPPSSRPSPNHNFQKHAVVTIKKMTKSLPELLGTTTADHIALQMWNIFLCSVILFGRANLQDDKYKQLLKSCFFGEICNYDSQLVRVAQDILRMRVLDLLIEDALKLGIQRNRHIRMKQQFTAYFLQLLELMRQGPLLKFRINSNSCKRIIDRVRTVASINEERSRRSRPG